MPSNTLNSRIQLKYDTESNWTNVNTTFRPLSGELCIFKMNDGSLKFKVGDGTSYLYQLSFVNADLETLISNLQSDINNVEASIGQFIPYDDSEVIGDCNDWLTSGYTKTGTSTVNLPSVCTGNDRWGVLFFLAENAEMGTGTQMYYPIDGDNKGMVFVRSLTRMAPGQDSPIEGEWHRLLISTDIDSINATVSSLSSQVGSLNTQVGSLGSQVSGLDSEVGTLSTTVSGHTSQISGISNTVDDINTTVGTLNNSVSSLSSSVLSLQSTKLNANSGAMSGTPTAPTPSTSDNSTRIATTAYVQNVVASMGSSGPDIQLSAQQPTGQKVGDFWYKIL